MITDNHKFRKIVKIHLQYFIIFKYGNFMIVLFKFRKSPGQFQWNLNGKPTQLYVPITKKTKKEFVLNIFLGVL